MKIWDGRCVGYQGRSPLYSATTPSSLTWRCDRKVDVRLHGKGNSNSHGARPVDLIITMIKWIRTSRLSIKNSLFVPRG